MSDSLDKFKDKELNDESKKILYDKLWDLATQHYRRVSRDAIKRIEALETFKKNGYKNFSFGK